MIEIEKSQILRGLQDKIRYNAASIEDYHKYENILKENGVAEEDLVGVLKRNGFYNWEQYFNQRQAAKGTKDFEEKRRTEGATLGWILGIGGALLLLWAATSTSNNK